MDFLKKVMKKSKATWQEYKSILSCPDNTGCFPELRTKLAAMKELIKKEREPIIAWQENKPYKLKNGKKVNFSCMVLREQRIILL